MENWNEKLIKAAREGNPNDLQLCLNNGANLEHKDKNGYTAIMLAAFSGNLAVTRILHENGCVKDITAKDGSTALHLAAHYGHLQVTKYLVDICGISPEIKTYQGRTPYDLAASKSYGTRQYKEVMEYLQNKKANWNERMITAARKGDVKDLKLCIDNGANIEYTRDDRYPALLLAARAGHFEVTRLLLDSGCNIEATWDDGTTAFFWAAWYGHMDIIHLLLDRGCNKDAIRKFDDWTVLMGAAKNGHLEVTRLILDLGCNKEAITKFGAMTALMLAASRGHLEVMQLLLERGCNKDASMTTGEAVLHMAAQYGGLQVTKYLVEEVGISPMIKTHEGKTPYDLAGERTANKKYKEVMKYLKTVMSKQAEDVTQPTSTEQQSTLENVDMVPIEIKLMSDKKSVPLYLKLLESGSEKKRDIRLVIVGKKGSGKTSLLRKLFGESIEDVSSTNGIEIHRIRCNANSDDGIWNQLDGKIKETELDTRLLIPYEETVKNQGLKRGTKNKTKLFSRLKPFEETLESKKGIDVAATFDKIFKDTTTSTRLNESNESKAENQEPTTITSSLTNLSLEDEAYSDITTMLKSNVDFNDKEEYATLLLWDFAGDEEFYHTHQTFLSPDSIYLVVTKLDEADDKNAQDIFQLWMNSIHCYCRREEQKRKTEKKVSGKQDQMTDKEYLIPPVVLVGSHKDKVKPSEGEKIEETCKNCLNRHVKDVTDDACGHINNEYFISNVDDDDSVFQLLRQDILSLARTMKTWNKDYPLKFIQLEKRLQEKKNELQLPIISFQDIKKISTETTKPLDEEELRLYLKFHHAIRTLVYFEDLSDYIILDTQWLADAFKCIVTPKKSQTNVKRHKNKTLWKDFEERGILHGEVSEDIFKNQKESIYQHKSHILSVMEKFDIIISPNISNQHTADDKPRYYVPCMVKAEPEGDIYKMFNVTEDNCQKSSWLCFKFRFLPPHLMNHLIASLCREYEVAQVGFMNKETKRIIALFKTTAVFELPKSNKLSKLLVMTYPNVILIQVLEFGKSAVFRKGMYNLIADFVTDALNKIINTRFNMTNVKYEKRWECGLSKPECVTGPNDFCGEDIKEYYCETCTATHTFIGEWSNKGKERSLLHCCEEASESNPTMKTTSKKRRLSQSSEEASESNPRTKIKRQNQTFSTEVLCSIKGDRKTISSVSEDSTHTNCLTEFTKEEINFTKMGMIVLNILADVLFDLLKKDKPNLRPRSDCDITYMYSELRKLNKHIPTNSWGGTWLTIQITDIAIGDDIERIRLTRNELQHSRTFVLDDIRFNELYNIIIELVKRFDQHNQPTSLYSVHLNKILAKIISGEEVKILQHQIRNEVDYEIKVKIEHKVKVVPQ